MILLWPEIIHNMISVIWKLIETCFVLYSQFYEIFYVCIFEKNMYYSVTNFLVTKVIIEIFYFLTDCYFVCSMSLCELD